MTSQRRGLAAAVVAVAALVAGMVVPAASSAAPTSPRGTYVGTLGGDPVVVQVGTGTSGIGDRYFRRADGRDVPLQEVTVRGSLVTAEEHDPDAAFSLRARLRLTASAGRLRGTWTAVATGRSVPVALRRATAADVAAGGPDAPVVDEWRRTDLYAALRLDRPLVRVRVARLAGSTVTWLREPRSGLVFPRLPGAGAVNGALADEHLRRADAALSCPLADGWDEKVHVSLLTRRVLSLRGYAFVYCGGAHPDGFPVPATFDLARGTQVGLEDLYRLVPVPADVDPDVAPVGGTAFDHWIGYRVDRGARLEKLARQAMPEVARGRCWGGEIGDPWTFVTWHLGAKGLVLQGDFPHVADVCDPITITLPWSLVRSARVASGPAPA